MKAIITVSKTFFAQHPRAGEATEFRGKVLSGDKRHTCRENYAYWKERIERIQATGGVLCVKQWIGRPYHQPGQEPITDIPADVVGLQKLELRRELTTVEHRERGRNGMHTVGFVFEYAATVDGQPVPIEVLAAYDGLTAEDYTAWFALAFGKAERKYPPVWKRGASEKSTTIEFAVIHFTKFRY